MPGPPSSRAGRAGEALRREIGRLGFAAITLNGMIGGGIFALPAIAAASAGAFSPWLFLGCGLAFMTVVLSFARVASFFSVTGGPSVYAGEAFGLFAGFQTGWLLYLGRISAMAANSTVLVSYASYFWPPLAAGWPRGAALVLLCGGLTAVNVLGVRQGLQTVLALTVLKLVPLSLLVGLGLAQSDPRLLLAAGMPLPVGLGETALIVLYAFIGFEGAVIPAGEGRDPRRDIPRAMVVTVVLTAAFYFLIQFVAVSTIADLGGRATPLADVAAVLMGPIGAGFLTLGAVLSVGGNLSALVLAAPRMTYALAIDGTLPAWFGRIHPRFRTPANSILFLGAFALALALTGSFVLLAVMSTLARLLGYGVCTAALWRFERTRSAGDDPFRLPGGRAIPLLAIALCLGLASQAPLRAWLTTLAFIALGAALFGLSRRRR